MNRASTVIGIWAGVLIGLGLGLILLVPIMAMLMHHMFIVGVSSPVAWLFIASPFLLLLAAALLAIRSLRRKEPYPRMP